MGWSDTKQSKTKQNKKTSIKFLNKIKTIKKIHFYPNFANTCSKM
jgi:hypothetical protein